MTMYNTVRLKTSQKAYTFVQGRQRRRTKSCHFVGIGGCGMSGLAQVLQQRGHKISGSDIQDSEVVQRLVRKGIPVTIGHTADCVPPDIDCMVITAAATEDNPEWSWALTHGVRVLKYAEMLGEITREVDTIAIAGTHGKSTTSAWVGYILKIAGMDPSYVIGADVDQLGGTGSGAGQGQYLVVEACEYDRSFLNLSPRIAGLLNIEADHLDYYKNVDEIEDAFSEFAHLAADGLVIANGDDPRVRRAMEKQGVGTYHLYGDKHYADLPRTRCQFFSLQGQGDWTVENIEYRQGCGEFDINVKGHKLTRVALRLPGRHNVANALAAAAMAYAAGADTDAIRQGLRDYRGADRRMTFKKTINDIMIMDDYAHHPTEIKVTLEAIRAHYRPRRLWVVFQPHQLSRTRFFLDEFALSFQQADVVLLPDIYFVRDSEKMRRIVNAEQLAERINDNHGYARYLGDFMQIIDVLVQEVAPGDMVLTMGAGDVWKVADEFICRLGNDR